MKRLLALLLVPILAGFADAQFSDPNKEFLRSNGKFLAAFKEIVKKPSESTVRVLSIGKDSALGIIVGPDGWILTKAHDLKGHLSVRVKSGQTYDAKLVAIHTPHDLALLKIGAKGLTPIELSDSKNVMVGSWLAGVGLNEEPVSVGVVSVATRNLKGVLGAGQDITKMPYLGVAMEPTEGGIKVGQVMPNTPAAKAGIKANDLLFQFEGTDVREPDEFMKLLGKFKPGDTVKLKIRRGDMDLDFTPKLEARPKIPDGRGDFQNRMGSELSSRRTGYPTILQHDAIVFPADCGGPIVDLEGRVIGINICRAGRTESWVIPAEVIKPLLFEMMSGKFPPPSEKDWLSKLTLLEKIDSLRMSLAASEAAGTETSVAELREMLKNLELEQRSARDKTMTDSVDRMLVLIRDRLALMNEVAGYKWSHRMNVADPAREEELLKVLTAEGQKLNIPSATIKTFFTQQFEVSRKFQEERIAQWQKDGVTPEVKVKDLKELRPKIETVSKEMVQVLAKLQSCIYEPAVQNRLAAQAKTILTGNGINDGLRTKSLEWLSKR